MKKSLLVLTLLIAFSAILLNSCSKSDSTAATPKPPSPVYGIWSRIYNGSVFLKLTLLNDYTYSLTGGTFTESGNYSISAPSITFNSNAGIGGCSGKPGQYNYAITTVNSATVLTLSLVSDSCSNRSSGITGAWNKQ